jgi:class 3 adenylate cyclase/TolB-like protein
VALVPTLHVDRLEGRLRYRLEVPERDIGRPIQEEFSQRVDDTTLMALQRGVDGLLRSADSPSFPDIARSRGSVLYRTLVPERLRGQLDALSGPILISTSLYGLSWELLHDDQDFWGLRYAIGKRIVMERAVPSGAASESRGRCRALVIGSDPRGDLPFVDDEVDRVCERLGQLADISCVSGPMATFDAVAAQLSKSFDLIHYCGHVVASGGEGPALLLAEERLLSASVIEANVKGRPLVFVNGCASVRGKEGASATVWEQDLSSVAYGFLFGGAVAVVGTLCDVSDRHAADLAEEFYQRVLEPVPIGEAMRLARLQCRRVSPSSPAWLSFVLYGNPAQVLLPTPVEVPAGAPASESTRRLAAVLLIDVSEFSALMGEDDERTVRAVQGLHNLVRGIVAEMRGHADPIAGDAILATFDSVVAAVDSALQIQRRLAIEAVAGQTIRVRIGVHFGDLLLRDGAAFGDAINVAARLQTLARPGSVCISDGVYRHVRGKFDEKFVDLGRQRLKNISDPVRAYLILPGEVKAVRSRWRVNHRAAAEGRTRLWVARLASATLLLAGVVVVAAALQRYWKDSAKPAGPVGLAEHVLPDESTPATVEGHKVALGVMLFKPLGGEGDNAWMREAFRDGLNAQLSALSRVKVYSREFIDFLITRQGLTEIEAAARLGIKKMLSGSFTASGGTLRIEAHLVDVSTGVLESSYTTVGRVEDFLDLQEKAVLGIIGRLSLPVTPEEKKALLARRSSDMETLKLLLDAEGGAAEPPHSRLGPSPDSNVLRRLARAPIRPAFADELNDPHAEIVALLERYRRAIETMAVDELADIYADYTPEQQVAQERYFRRVRNLRVRVENVDVVVVGDEAIASYTRTDDFVDVRSGRSMHVAVQLTKMLRRERGAWKLASGKPTPEG